MMCQTLSRRISKITSSKFLVLNLSRIPDGLQSTLCHNWVTTQALEKKSTASTVFGLSLAVGGSTATWTRRTRRRQVISGRGGRSTRSTRLSGKRRKQKLIKPKPGEKRKRG